MEKLNRYQRACACICMFGPVSSPLLVWVVIAFGVFGTAVRIVGEGLITVWGRNDAGQATVPASISNFVAIEAGYNHSLAIQEDGRVAAWGGDWEGITNVPPNLTNAVTIAAGSVHNLAVLRSGSVRVWGDSTHNQSSIPIDLTNAVDVAATMAGGYPYSVALRTDGTVTAWGQFQEMWRTNYLSGLTDVVAIGVGDGDGVILALKSNGTIQGWDLSSYGPLSIPDELSNIVEIALGWRHCLALRSDGTVVGWGDNSQGQITIPTDLTNVVAISAGVLFSVALKADGSVVAWGYNEDSRATVPAGLSNVVAISAGGNHCMAMSWDGPLKAWQTSPPDLIAYSGQRVMLRCAAVGFPVPNFQWRLHGTNLPGENRPYLLVEQAKAADSVAYSVVVTNTAGERVDLPVRVNVIDQPPVLLSSPASVKTNIARTVALSVQADGSRPLSYQWLYNGEAIVGATNPSIAISNLNLGNAGSYSALVSNGFGVIESSVGILTVAPIAGWGSPFSACSGSPVNAPVGVFDPVIIEAGYCRSLAVTEGGNLVEWGDQFRSQPFTPIPVDSTEVVEAAEAQEHVIALHMNGTVTIWGSAGYTNQPPGLQGVVAVAAGRHHDLALKKDGTVVAWNYYPFQATPPGLTNIIAISACESSSLALRRDGSVVSWGPVAGRVVTPVITNAIAVAAGGQHFLALTSDGTVVAWGFDAYGVTNVPRSLTNVVAISAGSRHSLALQADGNIVAWGRVDEPQVSEVPPGLTNIVAISAGDDYSLAMEGKPALNFWRQPDTNTIVIRAHTNVLFGAAVGMPPIHYQWRRDGTNIPGANSSFLFLEDLNLAGDVRTYTLVASNAFGTLVSTQAQVQVVDSPPFIVRHPTPVNTNLGRTVVFSVESDGSWPISYQWRLNGVPVPGATNSTLTLSNVSFAHEGTYSVTASNAFGTLSSDGAELLLARVVAWGRNTAGETNPPPSLTNVLAISAGYYYGVALRGDGSISRWGARSNAPVGLTNVIQVDAGGYSSIALQADGKVRVWDDGPIVAHLTNFANGLSDVAAVAAGEVHFAALMGDGRVVVWAVQGGVTNVPFNATNVVSIAAAANYCLALRDNGTVIGWGSGPINVPLGLTNVVAIEAGATTAVAVRKDGSVTAWNLSGLVALPPALTNVSGVAVGSSYGLGLKREGVIVPWGSPSSGQTNFPRNLSNYVAVATDRDFGIGLVSTDPPRLWHYSVLRSNLFSGEPIFLRARAVGSPPLSFQWQFNGTNIIGATNANLAIMNPSATNAGLYRVIVSNDLGSVDSEDIRVNVTESVPIVTSQPVSVETNLFSNARLSVGAIGTKPLTYQWLSNGIPIPGATGPSITISNLQVGQSGVFNVRLSNPFGVVHSEAAGVGVRPIVAWGLGMPASTNLVMGATNVAGVVAGPYQNVALRRDGTLLVWGTNSNDSVQEPVPDGLSNVVSMAFGSTFGVAARSDGSITSWGAWSNTPALTNAVQVAAGYGHVLALTADGNVVAWGNNVSGQVDIPPGLHDIVEVAAGWADSMARRRDGTVIVWGPKTDAIEFARGLSNVVAISAFNDLKLAATSDGRVVAWGSNTYGEGTVPPIATNVIQIAAGFDLGVALRRDGTVVRWGNHYPVPTAVPASLRNVVAISTGGNPHLAFDSGARIVALVGQGPPFVRRVVPAGNVAYTGQKLVLSLEAVGQWPLSYQWRLNGSDIPEATNSHLWLPSIQLTNAGSYTVLVSNSLGSVLADHSSINVVEREPIILAQPIGRSTNITGSVDFEVVCTGSEPLYYQWFHNGNPVVGVNGARLQLRGLSLRQAGEYSVTVSNAFGVVVSSNASLSVSPLVAWGCSDVCPPQLPIDGFDVVALAAGDGHALALRSDGTVVAWGKNDQGQASVPIGLSNVIAISACAGQSLALRSDGTVVGWGWRTNLPPDLRDVVAITAGEYHDLAFKRNGEVVSWGFWNMPRRIVPSWATNGVGGAGSLYHSAIFRRDGSVLAWDPDSGAPISVPLELQNVVEMKAHIRGISALRSDGSVITWGNGLSSAVITVTNANLVSHAVDWAYSLGLARSGSIVVWQDNQAGETPFGLRDIVAIASGGHQGLALAGVGYPQVRVLPSGGGTAYTGEKLLLRVEAVGEFPLRYQWLLNGAPIAGATNAAFFRTAPSEPGSAVYSVDVSNALGATNVPVAAFSVEHSPPLIVAQPNTVGGNVFSNAQFSVVADGSGPMAYQWYFEGEAISGATNSILSLTNLWPTQTGVYQVLVSNRFGVVVSQPEELRVTPVVAWGRNLDGQTDVPPSLHRVVGISASNTKVVALTADGDLAKWGDKFSVGSRVPLFLTNIIHVASSSFNLALSDLGEVYEWDASPTSTNVSIVATGAIAVSAGYGHKVALKGDGAVLSWGGANNYGQTNVPMALSNVVAIAAGYDHSLALLANGTVRSWGNTNYGLHSVDAISGAMAVAAGGAHSLVLKSNGTVVGWGWNGYGQTNVPSGISNAVSIAAGTRHSMALSRDGIVTVWGDAQFGTLEVPQGLSNVVAISAGEQFCVALIESPSIHRRLLKSDFGPAGFNSTLAAFSGRSFILEATDSLSDTNWTVVASSLGQGGIARLSDTNAAIGQRFYRLRRE